MRKMLVGIAILIAMCAGVMYNVGYLDKQMKEIMLNVDRAQRAVEIKDFEAAAEMLQEVIDHWNALDGYTHVFIRHSEIDSATDAFYEYMSDLGSADEGSAVGSYQKLYAHLTSIATMEYVSLGSIF